MLPIPNNIKVLGFDLDQTLYPKSPEIDAAIQIYLYQKISEFKKVDMTEAKNLFDELYQEGKGLSGSKTLIQIGFPENRAREMVQEALENAEIAKFLTPNPEVIALLNQLKNKYQFLDILTGSNQKNTSTKLAKLEIPSEMFTCILTADNGSKSDFSLYKLWVSKYPDLESEQFLYIGDRVSSDYEKPRELGIQSILVNIKNVDEKVVCLQLTSLLEIGKYL